MNSRNPLRRGVTKKFARGMAILALMAAGLPAEETGNEPSRIRELLDTVRRMPQSAEAHSELGAALGEAGELTGALRELESALRLNPEYADAYYNLGTTYIKKARQAGPAARSYRPDLDRALSALRRASQLNPVLPNLHNLMGWLYQEVGDFHAATQEFRAAVKAEPQSAQAFNNLGTALAKERDLGEAVRAYERAVALNPHLVAAQLNLGSTIQLRGQKEAALAERQAAVRLNPKSGPARTLLGHALSFNDRPKEAQEELRRAAQLAPDLAIAHYYLGQVLRQTADIAGAFHELSRAVTLSPDTPAFRSELALVLMNQGRLKEAIANTQIALRQNAADGSVHYVLARLLQSAGRKEEAAREFQTAAALQRDKLAFEEAGLLTTNGIADLRAGKAASAAEKLRQAVAVKPDYPEALVLSGHRAGPVQGRGGEFASIPDGASKSGRRARRSTITSASRSGRWANPSRLLASSGKRWSSTPWTAWRIARSARLYCGKLRPREQPRSSERASWGSVWRASPHRPAADAAAVSLSLNYWRFHSVTT